MFAHRVFRRPEEARRVRLQAIELAARSEPERRSNGEEEEYRIGPELSYVANYSKSLPHNSLGEVIPSAYRAMLRAFDSRDPHDFERIPRGMIAGVPLINPQAGLAFDLEGPDAQSVTIPPAPRIDQPESSAEMGELYWMALLRDVGFAAYETNPLAARAARSLTEELPAFRGPRAGGRVTPGTLFRGVSPGDLAGPYVSQLLLQGNRDRDLGLEASDGFIRYGTLLIDQRQKAARRGVDYLKDFPLWRAVQEGLDLRRTDVFEPERLFIRNLRDLATYVHFDALYEAYLNACILLLNIPAPYDRGNPYIDSVNQDGFVTFGPPHVLSLVTEVATRALKAVWFQKWGVHRRLRPEELGGRIQVHLTEAPGRYPMIDEDILTSSVIPLVQAQYGSALLPQAYPEGSPTHPSYGAGHATVAGACVTILKAWFDESFVLPAPVQASADGRRLVPYTGPDRERLTVGGELNKLASNIALARSAAGVHWRSDYTESVRLGEEIAIGVLREQKLLYNEDHHLSITRFDGTAVEI